MCECLSWPQCYIVPSPHNDQHGLPRYHNISIRKGKGVLASTLTPTPAMFTRERVYRDWDEKRWTFPEKDGIHQHVQVITGGHKINREQFATEFQVSWKVSKICNGKVFSSTNLPTYLWNNRLLSDQVLDIPLIETLTIELLQLGPRNTL